MNESADVKLKLEELTSSYEFKHLTRAWPGNGSARVALIDQLKQDEDMLQHASITLACTKTAEDRAKVVEAQIVVDSIIRILRSICYMK